MSDVTYNVCHMMIDTVDDIIIENQRWHSTVMH